VRLQRLLLGAWLAPCACTPAVKERPPTPPVTPVVAQDGCPVLDSDRDGLLDPDDRCPDDAGVEPDGCPIPDLDGDGIVDPQDACIDKPETRNGYEDDNGCPDEIPAELAHMTGTIRGIYFELDEDRLRPASRPVLDRAVRILGKYSCIRIEISGHLDGTGGEMYCRDLSARRAAAVKQYLVEHGIDPARLESRGAGPDEPVDTNKTARGRARNRRIEFTILVQ